MKTVRKNVKERELVFKIYDTEKHEIREISCDVSESKFLACDPEKVFDKKARKSNFRFLECASDKLFLKVYELDLETFAAIAHVTERTPVNL